MQLSLLDRLQAPSAGRPSALPGAAFGAATEPARPVRHIDLGDGAWLELGRGWVPRQAELFRLLEQGADWEVHERQMYERVVAVPRLVASCPGTPIRRPWQGESVVRTLPRRASPADVAQAAALLRQYQAALSRRYGRRLSSISLAYYRDGQDSVAFHGDKLGALRQDTVVAILSLGAPRHFVLRRAPGHGGTLPSQLVQAGIGAVRARGAKKGADAERASFVLSVGEGDLLVMGGNCQETWEHGVPKEAQAGPRIAVMFREAWSEAEGAIRNVRGPSVRNDAGQERRRALGT